MNLKFKPILLAFTSLVLLVTVCVNGQTPSEREINRLKDEIRRRELVDRDSGILPEDKAPNRANLEKARSALRAVLQAQIDAKEKLKILLGSSMTATESQNIDETLGRLQEDMRLLQSGQFASVTTASPPATINGPSQPTSTAPDSSFTPSVASPNPTSAARSTAEATNATTPNTPVVPAIATAEKIDALPIRKCSDVQLSLATASNLEKYFCGRVAVIQRDKHTTPNSIPGLDLRRDFFFFMITLLAREGRAQYVVAAENERVDKQGGADASGSGSTSLVSKGSVPAILGFATDTGALLKSVNGSTITFRGNVAGLAKALAGKGFISGYDEDSPATRFLRRTSFSFSFDTSRGGLPGTFVGNKQQISNYSFRVDLYNKRDARAGRYKEDWDRFLANQSQALVAQIQTSLLSLTDPSNNTWNDPALQDWYVLTDNAIRAVDGIDQIDAVLRDRLNKAPTKLTGTTLSELRSFDKRFKAWLDEREAILDKVAKAPIVTFEYVNERPQNASSLSKFTFIGEGGFGSRLDLTFNGAITIFNSRPAVAGQQRVRDFQFATQFDVPFGEIGLGLGRPVLSFAGRYERLLSEATTAAGTFAPNTRGDIGVGQVKLTIPIKNSGIRIPFSFSFANRTELIKEKETRGNFGFTFDPDTLFAIFKPFTVRN